MIDHVCCVSTYISFGAESAHGFGTDFSIFVLFSLLEFSLSANPPPTLCMLLFISDASYSWRLFDNAS